jgi:FkbM family methyltransferase
MNIEETLKFLERIYPITGVIHVGVGGPHNLSLYKNLGIEKVLLIEANKTRCEIIEKHIPGDKDWKVINQVVAEAEGKAQYYELNNKNESGLIPPEKLQPIWPNIKLVEEKTETVTTLDSLVSEYSDGESSDELNLLVIDCLSSFSILKGAKKLLSSIDVLLVLRISDDCSGITFDSLHEILKENSLVEFLNHKEIHPYLQQSLFLKDRLVKINSMLNSARRNKELENEVVAKRQENLRLLDRLNNTDIVKKEIFREGWYYSLNSLDQKIEKYLDFDEGYFVELGASNGIKQSNTLYFEVSRNWRGVLIEPVLHNFMKCKYYRSSENYFSCSACVSFEYKKNFVDLIYADLMTTPVNVESDLPSSEEHTALCLEKRYMDKEDSLVDFIAPAETLNAILTKAKAPKNIDLLSLDVEGGELEVLKGVCFDDYQINNILCEIRNISKVEEYLSGYGYELQEKLSKHDYFFSLVKR